MDIALIYMVAGLSSRFGGRIKQLARVGPNNETLIELSLNQALPAGFTKIIFVVGEKTEKPFKEKFKDFYKGLPVYYAFQHYDKQKRDKPWGTADALTSAKENVDCPFIACNGDDLYGKSVFEILVEHLKTNNSAATIGYKLINVLPEKGAVNRARFYIEDGFVKDMREVFKIERNNLKEKGLDKETLVSLGIFAMQHKDIDNLHKKVQEAKLENSGSRDKEIFLQHEISKIIKENKMKMKIYPTDEKSIGITNPQDEIKTRQALNQIKNN